MGLRFVLTYHALSRFVEWHPDLGALDADELRQVLFAELERGVPYGGQLGHDALYLLPCGDVAAVVWVRGRGFVKTVLARAHAVANMQSMGTGLTPALRRASWAEFGRKAARRKRLRATRKASRTAETIEPCATSSSHSPR